MMRNVFLFLISFQILFSASLDNFETRQKIILDIKKVIQNEESIARAYEEYILKKYSLPDSMSLFYNADYLGTEIDFKKRISDFSENFNNFKLTKNTISYALKNNLEEDASIKALYRSDTFRKRTSFRNDKIYFTLEDSFAKHLYDLIKLSNSGIINPCSSSSSGKNCILNNHIYIKPTYNAGTINKYLMSYHIDKFRTGPIIITENTALHVTSEEFQTIPNGALLYDTTGSKYIKTSTGIEALK